MKALEKIASKMVQGITITDEYGWPPVCGGLFYQPERPVVNIANNSSENASEEAVR